MKKNKRYGSQYLVAAGISLLLLTAVFSFLPGHFRALAPGMPTIFTRGS